MPSVPDEFAKLREDYQAGRVERHAEDSPWNRRIQFEDGTVWFPGGASDPTDIVMLLLGPLFVICLLGTILCAADWLVWAWAFAGGLLLTGALIGLHLRADRRRRREVEARMERGLFLFADAAILRDDGFDRRIAREDILELAIRPSKRGYEKTLPWITFVLTRDKEEVTTWLTGNTLDVVEAWLGKGERPERDPD